MDKLVVEYCKEIRKLIAELELRHGGFDSYGKEKQGRKTKENNNRKSGESSRRVKTSETTS